VATRREQDIPLCDDCAHPLFTEAGEFLGCGRTDLGEVCVECGEAIDWGCVLQPGEGERDCRIGSCGCGKAWRDENHEGWGHYAYQPEEETEQ
jgi:hypothetical protein